MIRLIGLHFKHIWQEVVDALTAIMEGELQKDPALKAEGVERLSWFIIWRLLLLGLPGIYFAIRGEFGAYISILGLIYGTGAVLGWAVDEPARPPVKSGPPTQEDAVVMKHAKEGRNALLDNISIVCESLVEQTEIYSPGARDELAYPSLNKCIHMEKGVPVISVQLHYEGELDPAQFKERFNDRMRQKLESGVFSDKPPALFYDKDNTPHTAIQAIRCVPFKSRKYIRLDVVRVNEAALALMDDVERENQSEVVAEEQLYDDDL